MQAVILAGGLGTRLGALTQQVPKPMVLVAGRPYLEHQLRLLRHQNITDIIVLLGYLGEQIQDYFRDGSAWGLSVRYSQEPTPMGTGGAVRDARELLAEHFLLIYGDSYLPIDYCDVMGALLDLRPMGGLMVVYDNALGDTSVRNNVAIRDHLVSRYDKSAVDDSGFKYVEAGVLAFHSSVIDLIPQKGAISLEQQVFPELIADGQMAAYVTRQRFYDIGTPDRLRAIQGILTDDHHPDAISH